MEKEVKIIELFTDIYMLRTDIKTGITYAHYLIRKDKTIGEITTIKKQM